jgi:hypothetical protein
MKFKMGDRFAKKAGAGFLLEALPLCLIPFLDENKEPQPCLRCDDIECLEYPTCYILGPEGNVLGALYHVSECEMEPLR